MRLALPLALLAAACTSEDSRPLGPGGGVGGGGGGAVDAGNRSDGGQAGSIQGRLCLVNDMRNPSLCPDSAAIGGIEIENILTGDKTLSQNNGNFILPADVGDYTQIHVAFNDNTYRNVVVPIGLVDGQAQGVELPLVPTMVWEDLLLVVGINEPANSGSLAAYFERQSAPVENVSLLAPEGTIGVPIYDGPDGPFDWSAGAATGPNGAAILLGIPAIDPTLDIDVQPFGSEIFTAFGVPFEQNILTFITVPLP